MPSKTVLLATVGGQPQVVTFALDALLARQETVDEVLVLHLMANESRDAIVKLRQEFVNHKYAGHHCQFRAIPLRGVDRLLGDIRDEAAAEAVLQQVRNLIADLKQQGYRLHLCVSGGRRMMGFMVLSAAALLCDHHDRVWHMYTSDALRQAADGGAILHVGATGSVQLIQVPLAPWGAWFPGLRAMAQTPQAAVAAQMEWLRSGHEEQCQRVYDRLTERERATLVEFARGLSPQDVAEALTIKLSTVNTYKTKILDECRSTWGMGNDTRLDYHFLRERFAPYLRRMGGL